VGSTSGDTVAIVSNIDVFEVGANFALLSLIEQNLHTQQTCRKIAALDYFCRLDHEILFSGRAASEHVLKKSSSIHLVCLGSLNWNETGSDLLMSEDEL